MSKYEGCKDCGCPTEVCCKKAGAKQAYQFIWDLTKNSKTNKLKIIQTEIEQKLMELEEKEKMTCIACGKERKIVSDNVCAKCYKTGLRVEKI